MGNQATSATEVGRPEVPGFELLDPAGHGPLGVVFRARNLVTGGLSAVKIFNSAVRGRPDFVATFEQDTGIAASLHHVNVLGIQQRGRAGDDYFVASEFIPGGSLREQMRGGPMGLQQALRVGADVGRALGHAHQRRMLHRALTPENVFLLKSGMAKVGDFGQTRLSGQQLRVGRYAPPEERRTALQADGRADVYSAAFILYELITGHTPLHPLQPLASRVAGATDRLDAFFRRALARNPEERFVRAGDLTVAIGELLERDTEPMAATFDGTVVVTVEKNVVHAYLRPGTPEALARGLKSVEQALQGPGRWKLVYDLTALQAMGTLENVALIELHERCRERLDGVYFHAPIPHVRGSALVVGASVHGLPFKVFDSADSVRRHLAEARP